MHYNANNGRSCNMITTRLRGTVYTISSPHGLSLHIAAFRRHRPMCLPTSQSILQIDRDPKFEKASAPSLSSVSVIIRSFDRCLPCRYWSLSYILACSSSCWTNVKIQIGHQRCSSFSLITMHLNTVLFLSVAALTSCISAYRGPKGVALYQREVTQSAALSTAATSTTAPASTTSSSPNEFTESFNITLDGQIFPPSVHIEDVNSTT